MKPTILVVGSSNTDMVIKAGHLPQPGEEILLAGFLFRVTKGDSRRLQQLAVRIQEA